MFNFLIAAVIKLTNVSMIQSPLWSNVHVQKQIYLSSNVKVSRSGFHRSSVTTRNWQPLN